MIRSRSLIVRICDTGEATTEEHKETFWKKITIIIIVLKYTQIYAIVNLIK